jgi:hypothetical protein
VVLQGHSRAPPPASCADACAFLPRGRSSHRGVGTGPSGPCAIAISILLYSHYCYGYIFSRDRYAPTATVQLPTDHRRRPQPWSGRCAFLRCTRALRPNGRATANGRPDRAV